VALALCLLTLCIALKAYFAKTNTNIPLAAALLYSASLLVCC
jgi:hypothetical protein